MAITNEPVKKKLSMTKQRSYNSGERVSSDVRPVPSLSASVSDVPVDEIPPKGWALAKKRAQVRFSAKQKDY